MQTSAWLGWLLSLVAIFFSIAPQVIPVQTKLLALEDTGGTLVNSTIDQVIKHGLSFYSKQYIFIDSNAFKAPSEVYSQTFCP